MNRSSDHVARTTEAMAALGLSLATPGDIHEARAIAAALVGDAIATSETMLRVQARSRCTAFVARSSDGALMTMVSVIPLAEAALADLGAGRLEALDPPDSRIARPEDQPVAFYVWGAAGLTWRGRRLALAASVVFQRDIYPELPLYARAATEDGARVLEQRMGAQAAPGGFVVAPAWSGQRKAA